MISVSRKDTCVLETWLVNFILACAPLRCVMKSSRVCIPCVHSMNILLMYLNHSRGCRSLLYTWCSWKAAHEEVSYRWGHPGAHCCPTHLYVVCPHWSGSCSLSVLGIGDVLHMSSKDVIWRVWVRSYSSSSGWLDLWLRCVICSGVGKWCLGCRWGLCPPGNRASWVCLGCLCWSEWMMV